MIYFAKFVKLGVVQAAEFGFKVSFHVGDEVQVAITKTF